MKAAVFAVCMQDPDTPACGKNLQTKKQRRKFLVLYDMELRVFFLSYWTKWRRIRLTTTTNSVLELDETDAVEVVSVETCSRMLDDWGADASLSVRRLKKISNGNTDANKLPPPLKRAQEQLKEKQKAREKELQKEREKTAREEANAVRKASQQAAKSRKKGGKGGGTTAKAAGKGGGLSLIHI